MASTQSNLLESHNIKQEQEQEEEEQQQPPPPPPPPPPQQLIQNSAELSKLTEFILKDDDRLGEHSTHLELLISRARQSKISLSQLRDLLQAQQHKLNQTSLELFDNSYDSFYKLSCLINNMKDPIENLNGSVLAFRNELNSACATHEAYIEEINSKLRTLYETNKNKELAKRLVELIKRKDIIQKQLELNQSNACDIDISRSFALDKLTILQHELASIQPSESDVIALKASLESWVARQFESQSSYPIPSVGDMRMSETIPQRCIMNDPSDGHPQQRKWWSWVWQ